jgi:hypothetical protein
MQEKRSLRSRIAQIRIKSRQLFTDQPAAIKPFTSQAQSIFLQLPRELRDQIYDYVLASTRITFGRRGDNVVVPRPHALAILRVCRQIHHETHSLWISRILFSFEDTATLLNKLTGLPQGILPQIKNLRMSGRALFLAPGTFVHRREYYSHAWALKFLPELSLDRLTVLGVKDGRENYNVLDDLVKYGHGWRELYFIAHSSMLGFARLEMNASTGTPLQRKPQPSHWNEVLRRQDGADSQCSVTIYRSVTANSAPGSVMDPKRREIFEQDDSTEEEDPTQVAPFGRDEDENLMAEGEAEKEILVIVKRRRDTDISGLDKTPYKGADMRQWANGKAWRKIKQEWTLPDAKFVPKSIEFDNYSDGYDYGWGNQRAATR